jgi:hypothetical protein
MEGGAKSGAGVVQKAAQSVVDEDWQESPQMQKTSEIRGFLQILSTVVNRLQTQGIPPRGLEPLSSP